MASQVTESIILSASAVQGSIIAINAISFGSPSIIHTGTFDADKQSIISLEYHNSSGDRVKVHTYWMPIGPLASTSKLTHNLAPYETLVISNGLRVGDPSGTTQGIAISAYLDDAGDGGKITAQGHALVIDQPLEP